MYILEFIDEFWKAYNKLTKGNTILQKQFVKALQQISEDPFYPSLKTHKVDTKKYDGVFSSWINGDVRIIWVFNEEQELTILILETETHSGSNKVYKIKSN